MRRLTPESAERVVQSRFLIMQSKRLLLMSAQRHATLQGTEQMRERLQRLRSESEVASDAYRQIVLAFGTPGHPDYWPVTLPRNCSGPSASHSRIAIVYASSPDAAPALHTRIPPVFAPILGTMFCAR